MEVKRGPARVHCLHPQMVKGVSKGTVRRWHLQGVSGVLRLGL